VVVERHADFYERNRESVHGSLRERNNSHVGVYFYNAYNCWVKNVRSLNSNRNHVWFYQSAHVTARDSYFYGTANAASQSYGAEQFMGADI